MPKITGMYVYLLVHTNLCGCLAQKFPFSGSILLAVLLCFCLGGGAGGGNQILSLGNLKLVIDTQKASLELIHGKGGI